MYIDSDICLKIIDELVRHSSNKDIDKYLSNATELPVQDIANEKEFAYTVIRKIATLYALDKCTDSKSLFIKLFNTNSKKSKVTMKHGRKTKQAWLQLVTDLYRLSAREPSLADILVKYSNNHPISDVPSLRYARMLLMTNKHILDSLISEGLVLKDDSFIKDKYDSLSSNISKVEDKIAVNKEKFEKWSLLPLYEKIALFIIDKTSVSGLSTQLLDKANRIMSELKVDGINERRIDYGLSPLTKEQENEVYDAIGGDKA